VTSPNTSPVAVASATAAATTVTTPVAATTAVVGTAASKTTIQAESVTPISEVEKETAEEMLLFWYEKASPEAKQRFKALINSQ
jgi:uncharacterized protein YccT (UPF0319 family)